MFHKKSRDPFADRKLEGFVSPFHSQHLFLPSLFILMFLYKINACEK